MRYFEDKRSKVSLVKTNTKNEGKKLRVKTLAIAKLGEQNTIGSNREKSNIAIAILTR